MRAGTNKTLTVLLGGALAVILATPSSADLHSVSDPDDSDGVLDLMVVEHDHETDEISNKQLLVHRLSTYEEWDNDVLGDDPIANNLSIYFVVGGGAKQKTIVVDTEADGSLYAEMRSSGGSVTGYARVWRVDERTLAIAFPKRLLRRRLKAYEWWAVSATQGDCGPGPVPGCPPNLDRVPDEGRIRHDI